MNIIKIKISLIMACLAIIFDNFAIKLPIFPSQQSSIRYIAHMPAHVGKRYASTHHQQSQPKPIVVDLEPIKKDHGSGKTIHGNIIKYVRLFKSIIKKFILRNDLPPLKKQNYSNHQNEITASVSWVSNTDSDNHAACLEECSHTVVIKTGSDGKPRRFIISKISKLADNKNVIEDPEAFRIIDETHQSTK